MHDTEGWKSLDTSINCLKNLLEAVCEMSLDVDMQQVYAVVLKSA